MSLQCQKEQERKKVGKTFPHPQVILLGIIRLATYLAAPQASYRLQINVRRHIYSTNTTNTGNTGVEGREIQTKLTIGLRIPSQSDTCLQAFNSVSMDAWMGDLRTAVSPLHETQTHTDSHMHIRFTTQHE